MIIILNRFGQLGNQLMLFSKFITLALEEKLDVLNPAFTEYASSFEFFANNQLGRIPMENSFWSKTRARARVFRAYLRAIAYIAERLPSFFPGNKVLRAGSGKTFDLASHDFIGMSRSKTVYFLEGWPRLEVDYKGQYAERLRDIFRPISEHEQAVSGLEKEGRKLGDILVGVHVRQGDYQNWEEGKYYYSSQQYAEIMSRVEKLFPGDRVAFFIASDEPQAISDYADYSAVFGGKNAVEDMYSLAACDYIVGPPSTFSAWSSFYGRTPRYTIKDFDSKLALKDFLTPKA